MRKTILIFSVFFVLFAVSISYAAQKYQDVSLSDGVSESSAGNYKNTVSVNNGIIFTTATATMDYILDTGSLTPFYFPPNDDIVFFDHFPTDTMTSTTTVVQVGVTVKTLQSNSYLRQIKYRVSSGNVPNPQDQYTEVWNSANEQYAKEKTVSALVTSGLKPGTNYIEWYAQNDKNVNGRTVIYVINIEGGGYVKIIEPKVGSIASAEPLIKAQIHSSNTFDKDKVSIKFYVGKSTITATAFHVVDSNTIDMNTIIDDAGNLIYKYAGKSLISETDYSVCIEMLDNADELFSAISHFQISKEPISQLLPYPSPYNPKSGKPLKIKYIIDDDASVSINIYDRAGKLVSKVIDSERRSVGTNEEKWYAKSYSGEDLANGIYICEIITKSGKENRRYVSFAILRK